MLYQFTITFADWDEAKVDSVATRLAVVEQLYEEGGIGPFQVRKVEPCGAFRPMEDNDYNVTVECSLATVRSLQDLGYLVSPVPVSQPAPPPEGDLMGCMVMIAAFFVIAAIVML